MRPLKGALDPFPLVAPNSLVHSPIRRCSLGAGLLPLPTAKPDEGTLELTRLGTIIQLAQTPLFRQGPVPTPKPSIRTTRTHGLDFHLTENRLASMAKSVCLLRSQAKIKGL